MLRFNEMPTQETLKRSIILEIPAIPPSLNQLLPTDAPEKQKEKIQVGKRLLKPAIAGIAEKYGEDFAKVAHEYLAKVKIPIDGKDHKTSRRTAGYLWYIKRQWYDIVGAHTEHLRPEKPFEKAIVWIIYRFRTNIRRDPDNYTSKFLIDALVKHGFLVDDSFENIEIRVRRGRKAERDKTIVIIEPVEEETA
jgi:crossover junction endodeoxyribonuclease RusA